MATKLVAKKNLEWENCIGNFFKEKSALYQLFLLIQLQQSRKIKIYGSSWFLLNLTKNNFLRNSLCGIMVIMLTLSVVDHGFNDKSDQTKDYKIDICCFSVKHTALRSKSKEWLARNQDNDCPEWINMSTCGLFFQWGSTRTKPT
jgi:hypothetical protein